MEQVVLCKSSQVVANHQLAQEKLAKKEKKLSAKKSFADPQEPMITKSPELKQAKLNYRKRDAKLMGKVDANQLDSVGDNQNV